MRRLAYCTLAGLSAEDDDDGQEAVHAAVVASEKSSEKWTSMLLDKLKSCRDEAERSLVVEQAERGVLEGKPRVFLSMRSSPRRQRLNKKN